MREDEVEEYLESVSMDITFLEEKLQNDIQNPAITSLSKPKVASSLENLRRCLDYITKDVFEIVILPSLTNFPEEKREKLRKNSKFPYGKDLSQFTSMLNSSLPDLENLDQDVFMEFKSIQLFENKQSTVYDLCSRTNTLKHDHSNQIKQELNDGLIVEDSFYIKNSSDILFVDCSIEDKKIDYLRINDSDTCDVELIANLPLELRSINHRTTFCFKDSKIDVLNLITHSLIIILKFKEKIYYLLQKNI